MQAGEDWSQAQADLISLPEGILRGVLLDVLGHLLLILLRSDRRFGGGIEET